MDLSAMLKNVLDQGRQSVSSAGGAPLSGMGTAQGAVGGLLAGGALGMLLGNRKFRKLGGSLLGYGGAAGLGALAYKLVQDHREKTASEKGADELVSTGVAPGANGDPRLPGVDLEPHARTILRALIAAARADGHVDARERALLEERLGALAADADTRAWVAAELERPVDPAAIAAEASSVEQAAEIYLVSALVIDSESFMERAYLDELAKRLAIDAELRQAIDARVREAAPVVSAS